MAYETIDEIVKAFAKLKVLIIGDVMLDAYIYGSTDRISPEAPVPVVHVKRKEKRLGGAANVALNIQALGAEPILCSVIGDDNNGTEFKDLLNKQGISSEGIIQSQHRITTVKHRVLAGSQQMLRIDEESESSLEDLEEKSLLNHISNLIEKVDLVIFEDYDKGTLNERVITKSIAKAKKQNKPVIVDPKKKNFKHYKQATLFKPNLKELKEGLKIELGEVSQESLDAVVGKFKQDYSLDKVMITLSEKGLYLNGTHDSKIVPAHLRSIADVSGAGDTVVSITGLCLALGLPDDQIARLANIGGGLVCEYLGVVPVKKDDLIKEATRLGIVS